MNNLRERRISPRASLGLLSIASVLIVALTGFGLVYVHNSNLNNSQTIVVHSSPSKLASYTLPTEKLNFSYGSNWRLIGHNQSTNSCGQTDEATLQDSNFVLAFGYGSLCDHPATVCYAVADSGCRAESTTILEKTLADDPTYIIAYRRTADNGAHWTYGLSLTNEEKCSTDLCSISPHNLPFGVGTSVINGAYRLPKSQPKSLAEYQEMPEVRSAVAILKTTRY